MSGVIGEEGAGEGESIEDENDTTHVDVLIATQMLFLNNFCEPLCQQGNETLICLYKCVIMPKKGDLMLIGVKPENEERMALIQKHIVLATCAMFYNHGQVAVKFFQEHSTHFNAFLRMIRKLLPLGLAEYGQSGHLSTYEVKLLVCGLSKAFFRANWDDLPFQNAEDF